MRNVVRTFLSVMRITSNPVKAMTLSKTARSTSNVVSVATESFHPVSKYVTTRDGQECPSYSITTRDGQECPSY